MQKTLMVTLKSGLISFLQSSHTKKINITLNLEMLMHMILSHLQPNHYQSSKMNGSFK